MTSLQLRCGRQLIPIPEDGEEGTVHPHLRREWRRKDGGIQEDPAVLRRHLSGQRSGADRQRPPAAVQPSAGGEPHREGDQKIRRHFFFSYNK